MGSIRRGLCVCIQGAIFASSGGAELPQELTPPDDEQVQAAFRNCLSAQCAEVFIACPADANERYAALFPGVPLLSNYGALSRAEAKPEDKEETKTEWALQISSLFGEAWKRRYQPCIMVGTETPDLEPALLRDAFNTLTPGPVSADFILGPTGDGGFYLIGSKLPQPGLFRGIAGEPPSSRKLLNAASALGLSVRLLPVR